jgi:hypothetical protein
MPASSRAWAVVVAVRQPPALRQQEVYVEDTCFAGCARERHNLCTETDVTALCLGPGARATADWLLFLAARERRSFHEVAAQYLHVRLLCFDGMLPTVYDPVTKERMPAAVVRDFQVSFHAPTQGLLVRVPRRCLQHAVSSKHGYCPMRFALSLVSRPGVHTPADVPTELAATPLVLRQFAYEQGVAYEWRASVRNVSVHLNTAHSDGPPEEAAAALDRCLTDEIQAKS